jgi:LacI family transcriptional regulator
MPANEKPSDEKPSDKTPSEKTPPGKKPPSKKQAKPTKAPKPAKPPRVEAEPAEPRRRVTIYDIAKHAGVSPSAVSRALGRPGRLNAKTEQRIRDAAAELNFTVNPIARALPTGRTRTIGLVIPDITNPVYSKVVRAAESVAAELDYTLVLAESAESSTRESVAVSRMLPWVDGILLGTTRLPTARIREIAASKPVVLVSRELSGIASVVPDIDLGVRAAVEQLHGLGHTRIAYFGGPSGSWSNRHRRAALARHCTRLGITLEEYGPNAAAREAGERAFDTLRSAGSTATAIVAFNDLMAIGVLRAAHGAGVRVPQDLSVVGFDDIFGSDFTTPPLTTIGTALGEAGERAARRMLGLLGEAVGEEDPSPIPTSYLLRGTTGPAPA